MSDKTKTNDCDRREFLTKVSITLGSIAGLMVAIPVVG